MSGQIAIFEQSLLKRGGIGCGLLRQDDADEAADGLAVVDGAIAGYVRQAEAF